MTTPYLERPARSKAEMRAEIYADLLNTEALLRLAIASASRAQDSLEDRAASLRAQLDALGED